MSATIVAIPERQPLESEGIWRVTLEGEDFGRLVRRRKIRGRGGATWQLLQLDDMSDAQVQAYDAAMLDSP